MAPLRLRIVDPPRHGEDLPPLIERLPGRDQRAALPARLDHQHAEAQAADDPVAHGESPLIGCGAERQLADEAAARLDDLRRERVVLRRVHLVEPATKYGPGDSLR